MSIATGGGPPGPRLPVHATVGESFRHVATNFRVLVALATLPALVRIIAELVVWGLFPAPISPLTQLTMVLLTTVLMAVFAVSWQRFVLLGEFNPSGRFQFVFDRRESLFFLYSILLMLPAMAVLLLSPDVDPATIGTDGGQGDMPPPSTSLLPPILMGIAAFVFVRLSMVLPAVSVDGDHQLKRAWSLTQGQFWRLFAILILAALPGQLALMVLIAMLSSGSVVAMVIGQTVAICIEFVITGVVMTALAISYRRLTGGPVGRPPTVVSGPNAAA